MPQTTCCLLTKDEATLEVGVETGVVDCDSCEVRQRLSDMDAANHDAWVRYRQLTGHRLIWDTQAGNFWMMHVFRDVDPDELDDVMARMRVLYDTFHPPKTS